MDAAVPVEIIQTYPRYVADAAARGLADVINEQEATTRISYADIVNVVQAHASTGFQCFQDAVRKRAPAFIDKVADWKRLHVCAPEYRRQSTLYSLNSKRGME